MCSLGALCCVCGVLGHLAPVHRCARSVCCVTCAVSWATWLRRSPVRSLGTLCCVCGVLGHLAPVHRCARWVRCVACAVSWATWLLFTGVLARCVVLRVRCPGPLGFCSPVCLLRAFFCVCGVLGHLAPVHRCARSVRCVACSVSWATWLLFTAVLARCVVFRVLCPGPLGSCSPVCPLGALFCVCGVLGHLAPVHQCARSVCCVACAVSWATWLVFTAVLARCVVLRVRSPGPLGSRSPVCSLAALRCVCGVLGHLASVHRCARSVRCVACAVSWTTWLLFTAVLPRSVVLRVGCPGPIGSCSTVCSLGLLFCVCGVLGHLAPVHMCACSVRSFVCAVSWATWLLFTAVLVFGTSCSTVCSLGALCCVFGVLGNLAPVHRCACSVRCVAFAVSWATWLLFTGVPARSVFLCVWCPGPLGSCSPVCPLGVLCRLCGVLGHLARVHRCARSVRGVACAVPWATWLPFSGVLANCVALRVRCPGPLGSCSPVCSLGALCCMCGILYHLAPVHQCACSVCSVACAVSWATWLLFTGVLAGCVVLRVRCPGPLGSCSPVCPLGLLCRLCGVLGHSASVHRCARSMRGVGCAVPRATWLPFSSVLASFVALRVRCPGPLSCCSPVCSLCALCCVCGVLGHLAPVYLYARSVCCIARRVRYPGHLGSCSLVCLLTALCCVCGVLDHLAPVHRCSPSVHCVACAVSLASWLLFTGVPARCIVLRVRCPGRLGFSSPVCSLGAFCCVCIVLGHLAPVLRCVRLVRCVACAVIWATFGSCSPVCSLCALRGVCGVLNHLAPVHRCARLVCCVACAVSWATWLLFTCVLARCVLLCVRCPGPLGSCSPLCSCLERPVQRCARSVRCVACSVSWATWLLFTGVLAPCVVLRLRCPGPLGFCSPVCPLGPFFCVCGVLGHLAPVHQCARSVCCVACAVSWATWLVFTAVLARCVVLRVRSPGPLGSRSPVCSLTALRCVCGVLGHLAPVHRCARSVRCVACAVSCTTWLLFTSVPARCVVSLVLCPGPLGSCSPACPLGALCCVCGVLDHLAPVHQCAR